MYVFSFVSIFLVAVLTPNEAIASPIALLPKDSQVVTLLDMEFDRKSKLIAAKIKRGMARHTTHFAEKLRSRKAGEPLAYDTKMGISRDEYQYFLDNAKKGSRFKRIGKETVSVRSTARSVIVKLPNPLGATSGKTRIAIDKKSFSMRLTGFSKFAPPEEHVLDSSDSLFGAGHGYGWEVSHLSSAKFGKNGRVSVVKLLNESSCILMVSAKKIRRGKLVFRDELIAKYRCS